MRAVMDDIIDAIMLNMDEKPGSRDGTLKTNPKYKNVNMDIIDAVMLDKEYEAGIQVHQGGEINMFEEAETRMPKTNPKYKNVNVDIIDSGMLNMKYDAGIKTHQGRELIMHEKLETRNGMIKTTPKAKCDVNNAVETQLYEKPELSKSNSKSMIKSLGLAFENILGKVSGKHRIHEKPGMRAVTGDTIDAIMLNMDEKPGPLNTNPKHKNVNVDIIDATTLNTGYEAGIQVHQGGDINMSKEAETKMLKTNPKGKNNAATPVEDPNTVQW
jgi:hypothetical protein